jgi:Restriction endonuclease BamHI
VKIVEVKRILGKGSLAPSPEWQQIRKGVIEAIRRVDWPSGSGRFTINPTKHGNGVNPIQRRAARLLNENGWQAQYLWPIADRSRPGRMDAAYASTHGLVAFEWETGNVASCHRSINKICLGFHIGAIAGGILALASNRLYPYLTDRVGNIGEIERYFPLWSATPCDQGVLEIIVVEHDETSPMAPPIPKGREGWARL